MIMNVFYSTDNKQAVVAVLQSNSELIKDALSELDEVCISIWQCQYSLCSLKTRKRKIAETLWRSCNSQDQRALSTPFIGGAFFM